MRKLGTGFVFGVLLVTAMYTLQWTEHVYSFGTWAVPPHKAITGGLVWAAVCLLIGIFEEGTFRGSPGAEAAERFRREAKAAASFAHPNLVTVHHFGVDSDTRVFLVMELLEGVTLRQLIERRKRCEVPQILQVLEGVCAGLEAAHAHGLIHRDLKPENIFPAQSGAGEVIKILDFGLAKFLVSPAESDAPTVDTVTGVLMGTPQYMSPDQLNADVPSAAWDIWAVAVIAYEMLTGMHPFPATSVGQMHHSIISGRFTPLSTRLPEAPAEWQQFFERALSPKTTVRPQPAKEFVSALEKAFSFAGKTSAE